MNHKNLSFPLSDLMVFSHLRWDFVFQRPQHLISRYAKDRRVFFVEDPIETDHEFSSWEVTPREGGLKVATVHLKRGLSPSERVAEQKRLMGELFFQEHIDDFIAWYYTPMALPFSRHLTPSLIVYDCMDELSAFKGAPRELSLLEGELMAMADIVFTGGHSLYEAKKGRHSNIHPFPSSIDRDHFMRARTTRTIPPDQNSISGRRLGFFGVIDERMDLALLDGVARLRPDWNLVMIGPVVKIDPNTLPKRANIHYLGMKSYAELPDYLAGWDLAFLPFARNEATRYISPTKTPEYLAAGKPVVSTSIRDVIRPYGQQKLVSIADQPEEFVLAAEAAMNEAKNNPSWLRRVDAFLAEMSWDRTSQRMAELIGKAAEERAALQALPPMQSRTMPLSILRAQARVSTSVYGADL